jgi:hypothetical protein
MPSGETGGIQPGSNLQAVQNNCTVCRVNGQPSPDIGVSIGDDRNDQVSTLRPHEATGMLRAQDVMMQIGYPLPAGDRHIQIFYSVLDMG